MLFWSSVLAMLGIATLAEAAMGRRWGCHCEQTWIWAGDIWSAHNSQHLLDPYSFTHLLHGIGFWVILALVAKSLNTTKQLTLIVAFESLWEIVENTPLVINRYRSETASIGYEGDSIANSLADIVCCAAGAWLSQRLGMRRSLVLFVVVELALLAWIRDNLTLNIWMLLAPSEAIKSWQMGGS